MLKQTKVCYLCNELLDDDLSPDHIIPNKLFHAGDPDRPKLFVHHECNNSKSFEDQWFIRQLQLRSAVDQEAENKFSEMVDKAKIEQNDAYVVGKRLRNYKLAKKIFNGISWGLEFNSNGKRLVQAKLHKNDVERFQKYVETICKGLYIYHNPDSKPASPELTLKQYSHLQLIGSLDSFMKAINAFKRHAKFCKNWGHIGYFGSSVVESKHKGFIFLQFYGEFAILAIFQ